VKGLDKAKSNLTLPGVVQGSSISEDFRLERTLCSQAINSAQARPAQAVMGVEWCIVSF
jgi:hypothetical protein